MPTHLTEDDLSGIGGVPKVVTGSYVGDGNISHAITGIGGKPIYLKIWPRVTSDGVDIFIFETTNEIIDDNASGMAIVHIDDLGFFGGDAHEGRADTIISLDADGFTVDDGATDSHPNENGTTYNFYALILTDY